MAGVTICCALDRKKHHETLVSSSPASKVDRRNPSLLTPARKDTFVRPITRISWHFYAFYFYIVETGVFNIQHLKGEA